jgi:DNA-binding MarR family transcriptional regulator
MDDRLAAYRLLIADVYELAGASRATSERLAARFGQTAARWHVMSVVSEEAVNVPTIARRLGLARQSVQRVVNDLAAEELISVHPNPNHASSPLISLTPEGKVTVEGLFRESESSRRQLLDRSGLSMDDLLEALRVVRSLVKAFD